MPKANEQPLTKHTILLTSGTYERLQALYGDSVGAAGAVRLLINTHLEKVEKKADSLELDKMAMENGL